MRLQDLDTTQRYKARVLSSHLMTPNAPDEVREIVLEVEGAPDFSVGQSIGVLAPGDAEFGTKEHLRLYSVSDVPTKTESGAQRLKFAVKRVSYIDDYSGERYQGRASNFLCSLDPGEELSVTGPYGTPFRLPDENDANLILIGMGTGIAPFRAYVKMLYQRRPDFDGAVRLFYGGKSGLELFYMNDERDDFAEYYDRDTFQAFKALSARPHWEDPIAWDGAITERGQEIWNMLLDHKTYVYLAGQEAIRDQLDKVFESIAESPEKWQRRRAELEAGKRWIELLY
ncbi:MAG: ferredoxin-NADP reductase [Myxococcota bacterium]